MSKYKFDLSSQAKETVEWILERYHEDKRQLEEYKDDLIPSPTAAYSLTAGTSSGSVGNPTESIGIKIATSPYILWTERNCNAIERVLNRISDTDKQLIDLVYWKKTYNVTGAGKKIGLEKSDAYAHVNNILGLLALEIGIVTI